MSGCIAVSTGKKDTCCAERKNVVKVRQAKQGRSGVAFALMVGMLAGGAVQPANAQFQFRFFDAPDATMTFARGINNQGQVAGAYTDTSGNVGGFVYDGQNFTLVNVPNAFETEINDINDAGETVGSYVGDDFSRHGFRANSGGITEVAFPGALMTEVTGINNLGHLTGYYSEVGGSLTRGFVFNGTDFISFDAPGGQPNVFTGGINDVGKIVGTYFDTRFHGFVVDINGFTTLDLPGAADTFVSDINNRGDIVGFFEGPGGGQREGFVLRNGLMTTLSIAGASFLNLMGINDDGTIVGYFGDDTDQIHGFTATMVPEPSLCLWLLAAGLSSGFGLRKARNRDRR